jgi:hypothetical protein
MVAVWNGDRPAARRCAGLSINANFLKAYAERRRSLAENAKKAGPSAATHYHSAAQSH